MATINSDTSKINRTSVFKGILDLYYSKAPAGGAFSAYDSGKNTMIKGVTAPYGFTQKSVEYTVEPGFKNFIIKNNGVKDKEEEHIWCRFIII